MTTRIALLSTGVCLAALAFAAPASGAITYCVAKPSCVGAGGTEIAGPATGATLDAAVTAADGSVGPDRIEIGTATFTGVAIQVNSGNIVDIVGAGATSTILANNSGSGNIVRVVDPASTVRDLGISMRNSSMTGLRLHGGIAQRVHVVADPGRSGLGVFLDQDADLFDATVDMDTAAGVDTLGVQMSPLAIVANSSIRAARGVLSANGGGSAATVRRVRIEAVQGIASSGAFGTNVDIDNALIRIAPGGVAPNPVGLLLGPAGGPGSQYTMNARHVTIAGNGSAGSVGVDASVVAGTDPSRTANLTLGDSVVSGVDVATQRRGGGAGEADANLTLSYTNRSSAPADNVDVGNGVTTSGLGNVDLAPGFVNAAGGDFHLRFDSPLVDIGDPAASGPSESILDVDLNPRIRDGQPASSGARRDMGALEYQRLPPTVSAVAFPARSVLGTPVTFGSTTTDPDAGEAALAGAQWTFDGAGGPFPGASVERALPVGAHMAQVRVVDPTGLEATDTVSSEVVPAPPGPGGGAPGPGPEPDPGGSGAAPPAASARLTALAVSPKRFLAGTRLPRKGTRIAPRNPRNLPRAATISFTVNRAGQVELSFARLMPGRQVGSRCVKPTRSNRRAKRCTRVAAVRPRVTFDYSAAGAYVVDFAGRVDRRTTLKPGNYRVIAKLSGATPASTNFTVAKAPKKSRR